MGLLLAVNIFPLIWAIRLSFTGFMANLPKPLGFVGIDNYVDILTDEEVRAGLKTFSDWPTYPQLYVHGTLVGGLDIVKEMLEAGGKGNLKEQLGI